MLAWIRYSNHVSTKALITWQSSYRVPLIWNKQLCFRVLLNRISYSSLFRGKTRLYYFTYLSFSQIRKWDRDFSWVTQQISGCRLQCGPIHNQQPTYNCPGDLSTATTPIIWDQRKSCTTTVVETECPLPSHTRMLSKTFDYMRWSCNTCGIAQHNLLWLFLIILNNSTHVSPFVNYNEWDLWACAFDLEMSFVI